MTSRSRDSADIRCLCGGREILIARLYDVVGEKELVRILNRYERNKSQTGKEG